MSRSAAKFPHLPPGREPGPQSRRRSRGRAFFAWVLVGVAAFFVALGIAGFADPGVAPPWVFLVVFWPLAAVFLLLAWFVGRRRDRPARHFSVTAEPLEVRRGGEVRAELRVHDAAKVAEALEVGLVCIELHDFPQTTTTEHGTSTSRQTAETVEHEQWSNVSPSLPVQSLRFRVPPDAPFSHEGAALSFAWRVTAREPGRRGRSADAPLWVLP